MNSSASMIVLCMNVWHLALIRKMFTVFPLKDTVETPKDAIKDPYVLEFLGLPEVGNRFTN